MFEVESNKGTYDWLREQFLTTGSKMETAWFPIARQGFDVSGKGLLVVDYDQPQFTPQYLPSDNIASVMPVKDYDAQDFWDSVQSYINRYEPDKSFVLLGHCGEFSHWHAGTFTLYPEDVAKLAAA